MFLEEVNLYGIVKVVTVFKLWLIALREEIDSMRRNKSLELGILPNNRKPICSRRIYLQGIFNVTHA